MIGIGRMPCDEGVIRAAADTPGCAERAKCLLTELMSAPGTNLPWEVVRSKVCLLRRS